MLTETDAATAERATAAPSIEPNVTSEAASQRIPPAPMQRRLEKVLRTEWLGQTVASVCWIVSVLAYGISSSGDWLQLSAASSWLLANIAAALAVKAD